MSHIHQYVFLILVIFFALIAVSCEQKEDEPITITGTIPTSVKINNTDTLVFQVDSDAILESIEVFENDNSYLSIDKTVFGEQTRSFTLRVLYNPRTTGKKSMKIEATDGDFMAKFPFSIQVIE